MARIKSQERDTKYDHLSKLYTNKQEEIKIVESTEDPVSLPNETVKINRGELVQTSLVYALVFVVAASGYLLFRFI